MAGQERLLAKIEYADLDFDDHAVWVFNARFSGRAWSQGIGGYMVTGYDPESGKQVGTRWGMEFVVRFMEAVGVSRFRDLIGKTVYVLRENSMIVGVEQLETEGEGRLIFKDVEIDEKDPLAFPWATLKRLRYVREQADSALGALEAFERELRSSVTAVSEARGVVDRPV